jgi:hypothetical protein
MLATFVGLAFIAAGAWGILHWRAEFLLVMKGFLPISLFLGGLISLVVGLSSRRPSLDKPEGGPGVKPAS